MKLSLGDNWKSYFDIVVANARKPLFYRAESPFYEYDQTAKNDQGKKLKDAAAFTASKDDKIFIGGNALILTDYFTQKLNE